MRIRKLKKLLAAVLIGLIVFSCKKSFVTRLPEASLNEIDLLSETGVNATLIAAYAALDGWADNGWNNAAGNPWPTAGSNWIFGSVASDDATPGSEVNDQVPMERIRRFIFQPCETYYQCTWQ